MLEETRAKCRQLESEVEKRQLEAQDGWAAAAQLQQHFRNLHNVLKDAVTEEEDDGEPSEVAQLIQSSIVALKAEYKELQVAHANNSVVIAQLTSNIVIEFLLDYSVYIFLFIFILRTSGGT